MLISCGEVLEVCKRPLAENGMLVLQTFCFYPFAPYTDHAGLKTPVDLSIASPFSRQIAIGNAGPTSALESMGANPTFFCHFLNISPS